MPENPSPTAAQALATIEAFHARSQTRVSPRI